MKDRHWPELMEWCTSILIFTRLYFVLFVCYKPPFDYAIDVRHVNL